jgi:hypothetical protein
MIASHFVTMWGRPPDGTALQMQKRISELEDQLEATSLLLDGTSDGFCIINRKTGSISEASKQLMNTLGSTGLIDLCLSEFVDQKDWPALEHMYESKELHPLLVTCRRPILSGSESFDVKITPCAVSGLVMQVCFQVQGEVRRYTTDMAGECRDEDLESDCVPNEKPELQVDIERQARPNTLAVTSESQAPRSLSSVLEDDASGALPASLGRHIDGLVDYLLALSNCASQRKESVNRAKFDQMRTFFQEAVHELLSQTQCQLKWYVDSLIEEQSETSSTRHPSEQEASIHRADQDSDPTTDHAEDSRLIADQSGQVSVYGTRIVT